MGMILAQLTLIAWPLATLAIFLSMNTQRAIVFSLIAGYLFLPAIIGFDFKGIPTFDKTSIPNLAAFVFAMALGRKGEFRWPRSTIVNLLMAGYVFGPILTGFANRDPISIGDMYIPEITLYTAGSMAASRAIELMPFILGAGFLRTESAHRDILQLFVLFGIVYSVPIFVEVLKGPFLQAVIYRIDPGNFYEQQIRFGGFRAMVFLGHGLLVSAFIGMGALAAVGLWRVKARIWIFPATVCIAYLFFVLFANKSVGAIVFTGAIALLLGVLSARRFLLVAVVLAAMVVTYPVLRANGLVPVEQIQSFAAKYSKDRADSFAFRLTNEDMLLNRAAERPLLGWGAYGRNRIFVVNDWGGTSDVSVTDGTWIITLGTSGWLGYLSLFGLLAYPFFHLFKLARRNIGFETAAVAALLLVNLLDLIPNSSLRPITWLIAGALAGYAKARQTRPAMAGALPHSRHASSKVMTAG